MAKVILTVRGKRMAVDTSNEFFGTKRQLEILKRRERGSMSCLPRYRTLSMDALVFVDGGGTVFTEGAEGKFTLVVAQCIPG